MVKEAGKFLGWGIVVSIFEMDQNWINQENVSYFEKKFKNFCYLVIRIHQFLRSGIFYTEFIS